MIGNVVKIKIGVDSMKIVFYGAGNMASAIFIGMIENNVVKPDQIYLTSRSQKEKIMFFKENLGVNVSYDDTELLDGHRLSSFSHLEEKTKIVSVMAGTQIELMKRFGGSAFLYYIYEKYAESLMELGFDEEEALFLTRNLVIGAGKMVEESELPFSQLRKNITSKNGI